VRVVKFGCCGTTEKVIDANKLRSLDFWRVELR
jgi:hypothetical protein